MTPVENTAETVPEDAEDPELLALPAPPKGRRVATLALMALVVVASMGLVASVRHDLVYFFSRPATVDLGDVRAVDAARLEPNSQVRVEGMPMLSRAVRFRRLLTGDEHVVFPLAHGPRGLPLTIYVQVDDDRRAFGRSAFTGRLVTFSQLGGRMGAVRDYLGEKMGQPVSGDSFLLLADESPGSYAWALLLALLCTLFVLVDVLLFVRWFRPLRRRAAR